MKMGQTFTADCPLPTADYPHFHDKWSWRWAVAAPRDVNAATVSGGGGWIAATPDDETVVAGSGVPGLFGEAGNELMCPAS
jgi:hypothetical protein